ncbi:hypothetical protein [Paraburkholderia sp. BR14320]|uniref:hypothetical protein n=1 Tax=unclassified Paraburkholderia TaxID=2615204 RepID=UPI0034CD657B
MLKILGGESSEVTPVSHAFSGMNVVFGKAPGKGGQVRQCRRSDKPLTVAAVLALRGSVATAGPRLITVEHQSFRKLHLSFCRLRANIARTTIGRTTASFQDFRRHLDAPLD